MGPGRRFYYDVVRVKGGPPEHLKVRSFVGLIPLFACLAIEPGTLERLPHFRRRVEWYLRYRPMLAGNLCLLTQPGDGGRRLLALADRAKLEAVLPRVLDPAQFLSDYRPAVAVAGIGSTSRFSTTAIGSPTSRASRPRRSTAATPTGEGRSGFRSTT